MKSGLNISATRLETVRQRRMNRIRRQRAMEVGKPADTTVKPLALNPDQKRARSNLHLRPHDSRNHQTVTANRVFVVVALGIHLIALLLGAIFIVSPTRLDAEATIVDLVYSVPTDSRSVPQGISDLGEYYFPRDGCLIPNPKPSKLWIPTPGYEKIRRDALKSLLKSLEATRPPMWLTKIQPEYPGEAKRAGKEGKVVLEATIDVDGKAKDIVIKEDKVGFGCARAAIEALKASRFYPAKRDRESVPQRITVPYNFNVEDSLNPWKRSICTPKPPHVEWEGIKRNAFKPTEVTRPPKWLKKILPEYPNEAKRAGKEGKVVVEATIDVDGAAKDIVIKEDGVGFGCARAAIQALKASRFIPAKWGEEAVAQRIIVPYNFKAEDPSKTVE